MINTTYRFKRLGNSRDVNLKPPRYQIKCQLGNLPRDLEIQHQRQLVVAYARAIGPGVDTHSGCTVSDGNCTMNLQNINRTNTIDQLFPSLSDTVQLHYCDNSVFLEFYLITFQSGLWTPFFIFFIIQTCCFTFFSKYSEPTPVYSWKSSHTLLVRFLFDDPYKKISGLRISKWKKK